MNTKVANFDVDHVFTAIVAAGCLWMAVGALPVNASIFNVTTTADEIAANGDCSLREAVVNANDNAQTHPDCPAGEAGTLAMDIINLPAGTYTLSIGGVDERCDGDTPCLGAGTIEDPWEPVVTSDAGMGDLDITDDLTISGEGPSPDLTVVQWAALPPDADPLSGDRIFHVAVPANAVANIASVVIQDLTLVNGQTGLVPTEAADVCVDDIYVAANLNAYDLFDYNAVDADCVNKTIKIDQFRRMGGAIALGAGYAIVTYEQAVHGPDAGGDGGGADMGPFPGGKPGEEEGFSIGNVTLNRVAIVSNWSGADGGGIYSAVPATLNQVAISGNTGNANGGGIYNDAALTISGSLIGKVFDAATAAQFPELANPNQGENGGGLFDTGNHTTTIVATAIAGNEAIGGGGIASRALITINIDNSTISGNTGTDVGGGITTNGTVNLRNVTVANNVATTDAPGGGGGLNAFGPGVYNFNNTVLANNQVSGRAQPLSNCGCTGGVADCAAGIMNSGFYNIEDGDSCDLAVATGTDLPNTDPMLQALADNGGLTETHALPAGSPAVDQGLQAVCDQLVAAWGDVDQRGSGFRRVLDGNGDGIAVCDRGAFEVAAAVAVGTSGGGGGGGGSCVIGNRSGQIGPVLPVLLGFSVLYLLMRRRQTLRH